MNPSIVKIDCSLIADRDTFHNVFKDAFGFPEFYGRNMDAWIDCLTSLDEDDGMRTITIQPGQVLTIQLENYKDFKARCPALLDDIIECSAFVNWRRIETGEPSVLALSFHD
jgi:RNAse (barnase) inhibitor barstar